MYGWMGNGSGTDEPIRGGMVTGQIHWMVKYGFRVHGRNGDLVGIGIKVIGRNDNF